MAYVGTAVVEAAAQIKYQQLFTSQAEFDGYVSGTLEPQARKVIDTYCNHGFGSYSGTWKLDGNGKDFLPMPPKYCPLISVTSVTLDGTAITADTKTYDTYVVYDGGTFTDDYQNVTVVASYGYTSVPKDVEYVAGQLCANALREAIRSKMMPDLLVPSMEGDGTNFAEIMMNPRVFTPELKAMLDKYTYNQTDLG
jgi:hypothetical protein